MNHSILSTRNRAEPGSRLPAEPGSRLPAAPGSRLAAEPGSPLAAAPNWRRWLRQPVGRGYWRRWRNILTVLYAVLAIAGLRNYITVVSTPGIVGVLALLYTPVFEKTAPSRLRFAWPALFFITLFFLVPVSTTLYCAWACGACCFLESFHRRVERTVPFVLLLLTPIMGYFVTIFSFPIRLQLTSLAGRLIGLAGVPTAVAGNAITIRDRALSAGANAIRSHAFSVDPACVGLYMYVVSLLTALLLMNYWQTHHRRRLGFGPIVALLCVTTGLNVLANLLRIICLVVLNILPSNPLHNILGVVFLLGYILLPLLPVVRWTIRRFGRPVAVAARTGTLRTRWQLVANLGMAGAVAGLVMLSFGISEPHAAALTSLSRDSIPGYKIKEVNNSILQLDNGRSLVYIKPIPGFYYTDHTPTICWQGSGYQFTDLTDAVVDGTRVFKGVLELQSRPTSVGGPAPGRGASVNVEGNCSVEARGKQHLYTAWWYDNGFRQTTGPVDWRWDWIHGAPPYSVVNLTAATPEQLDAELHYVLKTRPFHSLLGRTVPRARVKIW